MDEYFCTKKKFYKKKPRFLTGTRNNPFNNCLFVNKKGNVDKIKNIKDLNHNTRGLNNLEQSKTFYIINTLNPSEIKVEKEVFSFPTKINYTDNELEQWKLLYEKLGSFKKVATHLKTSELRYAAPQTIKKNLNVYVPKLGLNFEEWCNEHRLISPYSHRYSEDEISEWIILFERIGTLLGVSHFLKKRDGKFPKPTTIKEAIMKRFKTDSRKFEPWFHKFHIKPTSIIPYSIKEVNRWEKLFEMLGSFSAVERYIKERNNGIGPSHITIKNYLSKKFKKENRDFINWVKHYHFKYTDIEGYTEEDVQEWKELFEQFGKITDVINYLIEEYGVNPSKKTIIRRLRKKFNRENKKFNTWYNEYDKSNVHWHYTPEQVQIMIKLYEEIGSFEGVQDQLESIYGIQIHPSTIKNNIIKYYDLYGLNFNIWLKTYDQVYYYENEVNVWEKLYQRIGSFIGVYKYLKNTIIRVPSPTTIERRLRRKFLNEKRDFNRFKKKYFQEYHESIAREYFKRIFNAEFLKIRPKWLVNPETGKRLELDGYNEYLKIAFEYNGPQHYEYFEHYHTSIQDFYDQLIRDEYKEKICVENKILLIVIPYTVKPSEMQDYIIDSYNKLTGKDLRELYKNETGTMMPVFNHNYFFHQESLDKFT